MTELAINDAGTWRKVQYVYVNDAGTWRQLQKIYVNNAGTWELVYQSFTSAQDTYSGPTSGTETVPAGAGHVTIEVWGGGGSSGSADSLPGGGAGYSKSYYACSPGQTLSWSAGNSGGINPTTNHGLQGQASTVSSGTLTITTMTANGGGGGASGAGGTASGGNQVNTTGGSYSGTAGGVPATGTYANTPTPVAGVGGNLGSAGTAGLISFYYTP